jgi:hypothetical protein
VFCMWDFHDVPRQRRIGLQLHNIPNASLRRSVFRDLEEEPVNPLQEQTRRHVRLNPGERFHWGYCTTEISFLFKFQGNGDPEEALAVSLLFHKMSHPTMRTIPAETFGALLSRNGVWANWMHTRDETLYPMPHLNLHSFDNPHFKIESGWYYVKLEYHNESIGFKLIQTELPGYMGGGLIEHSGHDGDDGHPDMMLTVMATKGVVKVVFLDGLFCDEPAACDTQ